MSSYWRGEFLGKLFYYKTVIPLNIRGITYIQ
jgi:hypothetical protein